PPNGRRPYSEKPAALMAAGFFVVRQKAGKRIAKAEADREKPRPAAAGMRFCKNGMTNRNRGSRQ
ncbi:MAG: hypothetical protein LUC96_13010, partial [Alistipes sp.]|uniref:hypothetical protein n=1 Tax=Alistipes sp. TaxID=1872444 RepID=UPI0025C60833